jgi:hypothetical protein
VRIILVWIFCIFIFTSPVLATRELEISSDKSSLFNDEELTVNVTPTGFASDEAIFIKGAFYQDGSTNYFGLTKSGDNWIKNSASTSDQYNANLSGWDKILKVKADFLDSGYKGNGEYKFKVGFYYTTSGGNVSSVNWSKNILAINLSRPDPTTTASPSPTNSPAPTMQKTVSPAPTIFKTPMPTPLKTEIPASSGVNLVLPTPTSSANVLGMNSVVNYKDGEVDSSETSEIKNNSTIIGYVVVAVGIALIIFSFFIAYKKQKPVNIHSPESDN